MVCVRHLSPPRAKVQLYGYFIDVIALSSFDAQRTLGTALSVPCERAEIRIVGVMACACSIDVPLPVLNLARLLSHPEYSHESKVQFVHVEKSPAYMISTAVDDEAVAVAVEDCPVVPPRRGLVSLGEH